MAQISGDIQRDLQAVRNSSTEELQNQLGNLAKNIVSDISGLDSAHCRELIDAFVSALYLSVAEQSRREHRRQKQAEGIAAAKERGVRFGPERRALPDNFEELRQAWRDGEMTLREAAEACGIPKSTFRDAALRVEMDANCVEAK